MRITTRTNCKYFNESMIMTFRPIVKVSVQFSVVYRFLYGLEKKKNDKKSNERKKFMNSAIVFSLMLRLAQ